MPQPVNSSQREETMSAVGDFERSQRENYRQVRERLWRPRVRTIPIAISPVANVPEPIRVIRPIVRDNTVVRLADEPQIEIMPGPGCGLDLLPLNSILREVAFQYGFSRTDLRAASRGVGLVHARKTYYYRAATETLASYVQIGKLCGGRDHTTVMAGIRRYCHLTGKPLPRGLTPFKQRKSTAGERNR